MKNTEGVLSNSIVLSEIDFAHFLKTTSFTILLFTYFIRLYVMKKTIEFQSFMFNYSFFEQLYCRPYIKFRQFFICWNGEKYECKNQWFGQYSRL